MGAAGQHRHIRRKCQHSGTVLARSLLVVPKFKFVATFSENSDDASLLDPPFRIVRILCIVAKSITIVVSETAIYLSCSVYMFRSSAFSSISDGT